MAKVNLKALNNLIKATETTKMESEPHLSEITDISKLDSNIYCIHGEFFMKCDDIYLGLNTHEYEVDGYTEMGFSCNGKTYSQEYINQKLTKLNKG